MKQLFILVVLLQLSLISGEETKTVGKTLKLESIIFKNLVLPTDSEFEKEAKKLIAQKISGKETKTVGETSKLESIVFENLVLPTDTEFEKEAKKLIAQFILSIATEQSNSTNRNDTISTTEKPQKFSDESEVKLSDPIYDFHIFGRQETVTTETAGSTSEAATATSAPVTQSAAGTATPASAAAQTPSSSNTVTFRPGGPSQAQILGQVNKILDNVYQGNISGIIDQSLGIRNNAPVRNLVNGIIGLVLCAPWDRLLGRCAGQQAG